MKKGIIKKILTLSTIAALTVPAVCYAAEAQRGEPVEVSVTNDGKNHSVCVFGTSLALIAEDGSMEISPIGGLTGVDVMIDGVVTKNVISLDAPAGQKNKMVLDENSIIVKNATPESSDSIKQQISEMYAAGATSIDLTALTNVTAYKVDETGSIQNASGNVVNANITGIEVQSSSEAYSSFEEEIEEIMQQEAEAARQASQATSSNTVSGNSIG